MGRRQPTVAESEAVAIALVALGFSRGDTSRVEWVVFDQDRWQWSVCVRPRGLAPNDVMDGMPLASVDGRTGEATVVSPWRAPP